MQIETPLGGATHVVNESTPNDLSQRGEELAQAGKMVENFKRVMSSPWDPKDNPGGIGELQSCFTEIIADDRPQSTSELLRM